MRRGLVVGKFMPLHRGHQLLIDAALAGCDDVTLVVYDTRPPGRYPAMPVELRARWVSELYPQLESIVVVPDPLPPDASDDPAYAEVYAGQLRFLGQFDRFYSSEPTYGRFAELIGAEHVVVDRARELVPVSGALIRRDPFRHRGMIDPHVYASLVRRVALVGTESSGKTTLARAMADRLDTVWTHEYGRELWEAQGLQGSFADLWRIGRRQRDREDAAARHAREFVFCDTNAWTTLHWSLRLHGVADARLEDLVDRTMGDYVWIVCDNDFGWVHDGTRELAGEAAAEFQRQQVADLDARGVPYHVASGPLEDRVAQLLDVLGVGENDRDVASRT
jgi:HTH-type transcriptional regulator, transcriptional repressor of NAD biosynthesis genes